MATRKVKRSIHLAQPHPQLPELLPVRANVYCTIGEMNTGLEQAVQGLETLVKIRYLSLESLHDILNQLSQLRAQVNRELIAVLAERETANARHFQQLCLEPQQDTR
jgi:hypothetical protein